MKSPKFIGLLQACGLAAYIGVFATLARSVQSWTTARSIPFDPIVGISLFLLGFVISALISGSIVLAYPAMLFFDGKKQGALKIVSWTAIWLVAIFAIALILFTFL